MYKIIIDAVGSVMGIFIAMMFYSTFWEMKKVKTHTLIIGVILIVSSSVTVTTLFQDGFMMPIMFLITMLLLSFFFISSITSKLLLSLVIMAAVSVSEILTGIVLIQVLKLSIEQIQNSISAYMIGVLASKLFTLFIVYLLKIFIGKDKGQADWRFNLLMAFMPLQAVIMYFIIHGMTATIDTPRASTLGIVAMVISLCLVVVSMLILENQHRTSVYKQEYELAESRLKMQLTHSEKLYQKQREMKLIRHDIDNNLIAISGMLKDGQVSKAINHIDGIHNDIQSASDIVDTGYPSIDAIILSKIIKAEDNDIYILYKVRIDDTLNIDQFDLAIIIASALDNAIEGIIRSKTNNKEILLNIISNGEYISVLVENYASAPMDENFNTSKSDSTNHGFGIKHMRDIANKYNGIAQPHYDSDTNKFSLKVLLKNSKI